MQLWYDIDVCCVVVVLGVQGSTLHCWVRYGLCTLDEHPATSIVYVCGVCEDFWHSHNDQLISTTNSFQLCA
jgi:hypothetical protein